MFFCFIHLSFSKRYILFSLRYLLRLSRDLIYACSCFLKSRIKARGKVHREGGGKFLFLGRGGQYGRRDF